LNTLAITLLSVIGGIWTFFKLFYKYKSKVLFITNGQIFHKTIWEDMCNVRHLKLKKTRSGWFRISPPGFASFAQSEKDS